MDLKASSESCQAESCYRPLLFIGVFSAPMNWARRKELRNSWMQDNIFKGSHPVVSARFIVGKSDVEWQNFDLTEENRLHGDIQFLDVSESYENLPNKSIEFFRWFAQRYGDCSEGCINGFPRYRNVMKLDDDSYPNLPLILPHLNSITNYSFNYIGGFVWNRTVDEDSDKNIIALSRYPAYAAGSGYILSTDVARKMNQLIDERGITFLRNDDTTIGYFLYMEDKMSMFVNYHDVPFKGNGCENGVHVAMNLRPGELRCMWEQRLNRTFRNIHNDDTCCNSLAPLG